MINKNKFILLKILIPVLVVLLIVFFVIYNKFGTKNNDYIEVDRTSTELDFEYTQAELTGEWEEYNATIVFENDKVTISGAGVSNNETEIKISQKGTYYITGSISDAHILIDVSKNDDVQLVLDNCSIKSNSTAPINAVKCNTLTITLSENSVNTVTDETTYSVLTDTESNEPDATIFAKSNLVINGSGKLIVNANCADGIASKDILKIINSNIEINAKDDGIRGKDYVAINNAIIQIKSEGDGIKSTNTEDSTLGYIAIEGGEFNIDSGADAIQAETILNISKNAKIDIKTTGEIATKSTVEQNIGPHGFGKEQFALNENSKTEDGVSSKGLKAGTEITIESGEFNIASTDDSIHCNGIILINNGTYNLSSQDDAIHADTNIIINNGNISITECYEGIESSYIEINDGKISVIASDDGINISGGNDSMANTPKSFSNLEESNQKLIINGGTIEVDASGDGLDANGSIYINGGTILVKGPTNGGNGPLDYDSICEFNGGQIIIYGASQMWQDATNSSTQCSVSFMVNGGADGDKIVLKDSSGNEIVSFTTEKKYDAIAISSPKIENGESYTLYKNNIAVNSIDVTNIINGINNGFMNNNMNNKMNPNKKFN